MKKTILLLVLLLAFGAGSARASVKGDLNGDGRLDSFDLILFRKELVGPEKQANHSSLADMDGDGKTQVNDLVLISNFVLGKKAVKV